MVLQVAHHRRLKTIEGGGVNVERLEHVGEFTRGIGAFEGNGAQLRQWNAAILRQALGLAAIVELAAGGQSLAALAQPMARPGEPSVVGTRVCVVHSVLLGCAALLRSRKFPPCGRSTPRQGCKVRPVRLAG